MSTNQTIQDQTLRVTGMTCDACARHVQHVLQDVPGVCAVQVDYPAGIARIESAGVPRLDVLNAVLPQRYRVMASEGAVPGGESADAGTSSIVTGGSGDACISR